jgi:hypothetical protein
MIRADTTGPPPERRQHGRVTRDSGTLPDALGAIGLPFRAESLLARLERRGDITARERQAGEAFQRLFHLAHFDPLHAASLLRGDPSASPVPHGAEAARRRIRAAIDALGGLDSRCSSCAWNVLGYETSVREWAMREGWGGRSIREEVAKGTLLGALSVLARHFGI